VAGLLYYPSSMRFHDLVSQYPLPFAPRRGPRLGLLHSVTPSDGTLVNLLPSSPRGWSVSR
jgi:hypothetical protein